MNPWLALPLAVVALLFPFGIGFVLRQFTRKKEKLGGLVIYPISFISALLPSVCMGLVAAYFGVPYSQSITISMFFLFLGYIMFNLGYPAFVKK
jgi:FtsH-binding integral membrane protein